MTQSFPTTSSIPPCLQISKDEFDGFEEEVPCIILESGIGVEPDAFATEMEALAWEAGTVVVGAVFGEDGVEADPCRGYGERLGVGGLIEGKVDGMGVVGALKYLN